MKEQKSRKQREQCSDPGPCSISILSGRRVGFLLVGLNMFHLESKRLHLHITKEEAQPPATQHLHTRVTSRTCLCTCGSKSKY